MTIMMPTPMNPELYSYLVAKYTMLCDFDERDTIRALTHENRNILRQKRVNHKRIHGNLIKILEAYSHIYEAFRSERVMDITASHLLERYFQGIFADLQMRLYQSEISILKERDTSVANGKRRKKRRRKGHGKGGKTTT